MGQVYLYQGPGGWQRSTRVEGAPWSQYHIWASLTQGEHLLPASMRLPEPIFLHNRLVLPCLSEVLSSQTLLTIFMGDPASVAFPA